MDTHIERATALFNVSDGHVLLQAENGELTEYLFENGILWMNGKICIHPVQSFHFEFRDSYGYRLNRPDRTIDSIETVGYVILLASERKRMIAGNQIQISRKAVRSGKDRPGNSFVAINKR